MTFAVALAVSGIAPILPANADAADGGALFTQKCTGCHTIGKGKLVGPDLVVVQSWKEADITAAVKRMQQMVGPLSDDEIAGLVKYLKSPSTAAAATPAGAKGGDKAATETSSGAPQGPAEQSAADAPANGSSGAAATASADASAAFDIAAAPGSAEAGRRLFYGEQALTNGGVSCVSCHQAGGDGGTMGPSLTDIATKMPAVALVSACETTPFRIMKETYAAHPVTKQEAVDLTKYFESLKGKNEQPRRFPVGLVGLGGSAAMMLVIAWGYRNRNTSVRAKLHRR